MRTIDRFILDRRGSTAVEFALIMPVLLLFLEGVVDFGRAFYYQTELSQALRSGMQYTMKAPTDTNGIKAVIAQSSRLPIVVAAPVTFCQCYDGSAIACSSTCAKGNTPTRNYVKLEATFPYAPLIGEMIGLLPKSPLDATLIVRTQ